jgi:hypothetical protein
MRYLFCLLLLNAIGASAQIPRNQSGLFEYSHKVTVDDAATAKLLELKAAQFFNQPFLVHWDSIYRDKSENSLIIKGRGYVDVRAKLRSVATSRIIPVSLEFTLEIDESGYRYTGMNFEFEKKPESVKQITYDQVLNRTYKRISYVTGYLKRFMSGEE